MLTRGSYGCDHVSMRQSAHLVATGGGRGDFRDYRKNFMDTYVGGAANNTLTWIPNTHLKAPPAGSQHRENSVVQLAEAAVGASAQSVLAVIARVLTTAGAAVGTGGFAVWASSRFSRLFGSTGKA